MRRFLIILLLTTILLSGCKEKYPESSESLSDLPEVMAAQEWLLRIDNADFAESWEQASELLQNAVTCTEWIMIMESLRKSNPAIENRTLKEVTLTSFLEAAPEGDYRIIEFRGESGNEEVVETITMQLSGGVWKVAGYLLR